MLALEEQGGEIEVAVPAEAPKRTAEAWSRSRRVGAWEGDTKRILLWAQDAAGLSPTELARRLGVSRQTVYQYRYAGRQNPTVEFMARWLGACGFDLVAVQR